MPPDPALFEHVRGANDNHRPATGFELERLTAREVCELPEPDDADELLGSLIVRRQRIVLGAHTGEGKTTMAYALTKAVTEAGAFLEWQGVGGRALVIDAEQGLRTVKRRLRESGLDHSDAVDYVRVPDGLALEKDRRHRQAVEAMLEAGAYDLVVLDPYYKLTTVDSNDERAVVATMKVLDAWRERFGFALILPLHCRKPQPGTKFGMHDVFGSTAFLRGAEVVLGLQRVRSGYSRLHFFKDRDGDLPAGDSWGLLFDREQGYRRDPDDGKPSTAERVRELREDDPAITQEKVAALLGVTDRTVRKYWHTEHEQTQLAAT